MSRFGLQILDGTSPAGADLAARSLHAEAIYDSSLGETVHLDIGTAIIAPDLAEVSMANEIRDVQMPAEGSLDAAIDAAEDAFRIRGARPLKWIFAGGILVPEIAAALEKRGYRCRQSEIWSLAAPRAVATRDDLMIIPARSSYTKMRELLGAVMQNLPELSPRAVEQNVEAGVRVLDDARVDALLALDNQIPVGLAYLVTAGQSGFVADLYTHPGHRRKNIATTLMQRVVELAVRSRHKSLTLRCRPDNLAAGALYKKLGWQPAGTVAAASNSR